MEIGSKWNGWTIEKKLGTGSFGTVYKVTKDEFSHHYESALKVISIPQNESEVSTIKSEGMDDESVTMYFKSMVEDITEELALMSKLKGNTNIVSYEDHIVAKKENLFGWDIYARMELLTPLNEYIQKHTMTIREVIQLGIDMCQALEVCQRYNIIHRDIKPENIFVSDLGKFKLGDFGIARQLEKTVAAMSKKGTYTYMAPEIYKGLPYNSTVDTYSLGIVLYRFLNNNRTPFLPPYPQAIRYSDKEKANILRISGKELPKPCNADGRLAEIVLKACSYKPENRYESAVEFKQALQAILYDENEAYIIYPSGDELPQSKESDGIIEKNGDKTKLEQEEILEGTVYLFQEDKKQKERLLAIEQTSSEEEENEVSEEQEDIQPEIEAETEEEQQVDEELKEQEEILAERNTETKQETEERSARVLKEHAENNIAPQNEDKSVEKENAKQSRKYLIIGIASFVVVIVIIVFAVINLNNGSKINVIGMTQSEAEDILNKNGISYEEEFVSDDIVPKGEVLSLYYYDEETGSKYFYGDEEYDYDGTGTLYLLISSGEYIKVPDIVGDNVEEAKESLYNNYDLDLYIKVYQSSDRPIGEIISQDPEPGEEIEIGGIVSVVVSIG